MKNPAGDEISEKLIDVEAVIASKNPAILRYIPRFVLSYLKRVIHQDTINSYIWKHRDKTGLAFVDAILTEFGVHVGLVDGRSFKEPSSPLVPPSGRYIVAANHPLGGLDGMALMHKLGETRQDLVFPVNDLLLNIPALRPLFIPINKHGRNTDNARLIDDTFASDKLILYFPAGLCSRKLRIAGKTTVHDLEWKTTFIKKAKKYRRDIIPVYIDGRNSNWFYNLANWRKRLGIKSNIEMLYLVDEMIRQLNKTISLKVGDTIPYTMFDRSKSETEWAAWVREKVYALDDRK